MHFVVLLLVFFILFFYSPVAPAFFVRVLCGSCAGLVRVLCGSFVGGLGVRAWCVGLECGHSERLVRRRPWSVGGAPL